MKKKPNQFSDTFIIDATRLRVALLLACLRISDGDLESAMDISEDLYDSAPLFLEQLSADGISEWFSAPPSILPYIGDPDVNSLSLN